MPAKAGIQRLSCLSNLLKSLDSSFRWHDELREFGRKRCHSCVVLQRSAHEARGHPNHSPPARGWWIPWRSHTAAHGTAARFRHQV